MPGRAQAEVCDPPTCRQSPYNVMASQPSAGPGRPRTLPPPCFRAAAGGLLGSSGLTLWLLAATVDAALQVQDTTWV